MKKKNVKNLYTRIVSAVLVVLMLFSVTACSDSETGKNSSQSGSGLMVGYGEGDLTPEESVPIQGSGNVLGRMSIGYEERIYVTCVAIRDENDQTVMMLGYDLCFINTGDVATIQEEISAQTGIPKGNIYLNASHNHAAPALNDGAVPSLSRWRTQKLYEASYAAALAAMEDMAPATMYGTSVDAPDLTFVRRYVMNDGSYYGPNYGEPDSGVKEHEPGVDNELQLIKFAREDKADVLLTNFQSHCTSVVPANSLSADFVGVYRKTMEEEKGYKVVFLQGAAGNMGTETKITSEQTVANYKEFGQKLAEYAISAEDTYKKNEASALKINKMMYEAEVNHSNDHLIAKASEIKKYWYATGNKQMADRMCEGTGLSSANHAQAVVAIAALEKTISVELNVISIGDIAFATAPFELFGQLGMQIKENSPYDMTFVLGYTNGLWGYLPSSDVWDHGGYEVDVCKLPKGGGELLADQMVTMLTELKAK